MTARVITVSDSVSRGEREDRSGPAAVAALLELGIESDLVVVSDGIESVTQALRISIQHAKRLVITTGGTGFTQRDLTPEATRSVIDRPAPGISEAMRAATFGKNPYGMLSRGMAGLAGTTLIINLPGSLSGVEESLSVIGDALSHAIALLEDPGDSHRA